jgi:hypothetical protein
MHTFPHADIQSDRAAPDAALFHFGHAVVAAQARGPADTLSKVIRM